MSGINSLTDTVNAMLAVHCRPAVVAEAERTGWSAPAWTALADGGFPLVSVPESQGGAGGTLADAVDVLLAAGRHALPLPLVENMLLAGWAMSQVGGAVPNTPMTAAPATERLELKLSGAGSSLAGQLDRVPWSANCRVVVTVVQAQGRSWVVAVPSEMARTIPGRNLAGEPRDTLIFDDVPLGDSELFEAPDLVSPATFALRGALGRAALSAGAAARVGELTNEYATQRTQFGRRLNQFQAVQAHLVRIAAESWLMEMSVRAAARGGGLTLQDVGTAKSVASHGATVVTAAAHQAHGAIGLTQEYQLGHFTRRLWSWRDEYGTERYWNRRLGSSVLQGSPDDLWAGVTQ